MNSLKVIYVAGYGRSGSTLLDMILGNQPGIVGLGELTHIFDHFEKADKYCSCGNSYPDCMFWREVFSLWQSKLPNITMRQAADITRRVEGYFGGGSLFLSSSEKLPEKFRNYGLIWNTLFGALELITQKKVIIDSSKTTRGTTLRLLALKYLCDIDLKVIQLVRDPRAVMWSYLRGNNILLENGIELSKIGGGLRMLPSWIHANISAEYIARLGRIDIHRIRYEDLLEDLVHEMKKIGEFTELDLRNVFEYSHANLVIEPDHGVAGNRLRRTGISQLRSDDEWRMRLSTMDKCVAMLAWPLASRYGYGSVLHLESKRVNKS